MILKVHPTTNGNRVVEALEEVVAFSPAARTRSKLLLAVVSMVLFLIVAP